MEFEYPLRPTKAWYNAIWYMRGMATAIGRIENGGVIGADDTSGEFWKLCGSADVICLTYIINQMMRHCWPPQVCSTNKKVLVWKQIADCSAYWPVSVGSHTLKIILQIVVRRLPEIVGVASNKCGLVKNLIDRWCNICSSPSRREAQRKYNTVHPVF